MADLQTKYEEYIIQYGSPPNSTQFKKYAVIKYSEASKFLKTAVPINTRNRSISTKISNPIRNISVKTRTTSKSMITKQTPKPKPKPKLSSQTRSSIDSSNPYLDSILTSKFTSPKENQRFIKQHSKTPKVSTLNQSEHTKCNHSHCHCTQYIKSTPQCSKGKCKSCNHSQQKHYAKPRNVSSQTSSKTFANTPKQDEFSGRNRSDSVQIQNNDEYIGRTRSQSVRIDSNDPYDTARETSNSVSFVDITPPNISSIISSSNAYIDSSVVSTFVDEHKNVERTRSESVRNTIIIPSIDAGISLTRSKSNSVPFNDQQMIENCMDPKVKQFIDIAAGQNIHFQEQKTLENIDDYDCNTATVIIDNGSETIKIGFSGNDDKHKASHIFRSIIGYDDINDGVMFGDKAYRKHCRNSVFNIENIIKRGNVCNWEYMERIWEYAFEDRLEISSWNSNVLLTECVLRSDEERERSVEILFESFDVNSMYLQNKACLSLYGIGKMSGTVLGIGYGVTYTASIYEGFSIPNSVIKINSAGYDLTKYLGEIMADTNKNETMKQKKYERVIDDVKHKYCVFRKRNKDGTAIKYMLPDGKCIMIGKERFDCCEQLFGGFMNLNNETNMNLSLNSKCGIQHMIFESIKGIKEDHIKAQLYSNIVLSGGSTLFDGLAMKLRKEILKLMDDTNNTEINIIANDKRQYLSWVGASIISSIPQFKENFIQKDEYRDCGKSIVHRKCPL